MLTNIVIKNFLLIEKAEIDFINGLCVITGETGAGKSILLDALTFLLGDKANVKLIRPSSLQAEVTATFLVDNKPIISKLMELDVETDSQDGSAEILVRRIINIDGKSKNFINDTNVSLSTIKMIGEILVEIHGQHEQRGLLEPSTHQEILDNYGKLQALLNEVATSYQLWQQAKADYEQAKDSQLKLLKEEDYLRHAQKELENLNLIVGEEEELISKKILLSNKEKVLTMLSSSIENISSKPDIQKILLNIIKTFSRANVANIDSQQIIDHLEKAYTEIDMAISLMESHASKLNYDEENVDNIESRLFTLQNIARKYNYTISELPKYLIEVRKSLGSIVDNNNDLVSLEQQINSHYLKYTKQAQLLSQQRSKIAKNLEESISVELSLLKMEKTKFKVDMVNLPESHWGRNGTDKVNFVASTNPGLPLAPLVKIASGGELSRFMLAAKLVLAEKNSTPTLVFDEIDTGIGGAVASALGERLAMLGKKAQVIVITHQPQVAVKADLHVLVQKSQSSNKTKISIKSLTLHERQEEVARMLAGEIITDEARAAAIKLISS